MLKSMLIKIINIIYLFNFLIGFHTIKKGAYFNFLIRGYNTEEQAKKHD